MKILIVILALTASLNALGQSQAIEAISKSKNITYIIDNELASRDLVGKLNQEEVFGVTVLKDSDAVEITKNKDTDAVISIISLVYVKAHYLDYLRSKSCEFANAYSSIKNPEDVVFIWNDNILNERRKYSLYYVDDSNFIEIKQINRDQLNSDFNITDKQIGFVVKTNKSLPKH